MTTPTDRSSRRPQLFARGAALVLACFATAPLLAQVATPDTSETPAPAYITHPDAPVTTLHTAVIDGQEIGYQATAGTLTLVDSDYEPTARIFYIAYRKHDGLDADGNPEFPDAGTRPITFSFNGGPGSSSVWLHLGIFGPQRVAYADEVGNPGPPPYGVINNDYSLLDKSDFVFIDPVSTGFSRAEGDTSEKIFHGLDSDIRSVAEFVRRYITREGRWRSPKFLAGESYGTTRAAGLAAELNSRHGIALNGIALISSVLNFQTIRFDVGNDLPHVLYLPTFAATAHYHGKLSDDLQALPVAEVVARAEAFAINDYAPALLKGAGLGDRERRGVLERLSQLTGLGIEYLEQVNLRPGMPGFCKELRRDEGITVGRLDSRFVGRDRDDADFSYEYDPSYAAIQANYTAGFNTLVREQLNYQSDLPYEILTSVWPWSYEGPGSNRYVNVAERLRGAMEQQPAMKIFVAAGYYDLATPHFAAEYTLSHMMLRESTRDNIEYHEYEAGHMMYVHQPSLEKLRRDLVGFYDSVPRGSGGTSAEQGGG